MSTCYVVMANTNIQYDVALVYQAHLTYNIIGFCTHTNYIHMYMYAMTKFVIITLCF